MSKEIYTVAEAQAMMVEASSKYHNRKTPYEGRMYDSIKEAEYARMLDACKKAVHDKDRVVEWEPQVKYPVVVSGKKICTYIADFKVTYADGRVEVVDVKSAVTAKLAVYRIKKKLVEALYGFEIVEEI